MIKGLALRPGVPDAAAVLRSLLGVIAVGVVAAQWGPPGAPTAAAAAGAVTGAVALQESPRARVQLAVGASTVLGCAAFIGAA
ncbi:MAG: FUSC family protein, partial [Mycobacterium sp.]|nr:FUSC family protein [Mycobacterium sp.]